MCVSTVYSVLSRVLWKNITGILLGWDSNPRFVSYLFIIGEWSWPVPGTMADLRRLRRLRSLDPSATTQHAHRQNGANVWEDQGTFPDGVETPGILNCGFANDFARFFLCAMTIGGHFIILDIIWVVVPFMIQPEIGIQSNHALKKDIWLNLRPSQNCHEF